MTPDHELIKNVEVRTINDTEVSLYFDHEEEYGDGPTFGTGYSRTYRIFDGRLVSDEDTEHSVDGECEDSMSRGPLDMDPQYPGESMIERVIRDLVWDFGEDVAHPLVQALRACA